MNASLLLHDIAKPGFAGEGQVEQSKESRIFTVGLAKFISRLKIFPNFIKAPVAQAFQPVQARVFACGYILQEPIMNRVSLLWR
jgi:hypothetical protein